MSGGDVWPGGLSVADQGIVSATSFVTAIVVGRFAGPLELARYSLALSIVATLCVVQESLLSAPLNVYVARASAAEQHATTGRALYLAAALAAAAAVLAAAMGLVSDWIAPGSLVGSIGLLVAVLVPALLLRDFARRAVAARLDIGAMLRLDALVALAQIGALVLVAWSAGITVVLAVVVMCAASGAGVLYWLRSAGPWPVVSRRDLAESGREHWRFGRWILAGRLAGQLNSDVLLLWMLLPMSGARSAGVFAACLSIALLSNPVVLGLGTYLAPRMAHAYARDGLRALRRVVVLTSILLTALLSGVVAVTWVIGPWLLRTLYGPAFGGHGRLVWLLSAAVATGAIGIAANHALVALERPHRNVLANGAGLAALVVVAAALIPQWAETGAALALWAGNAAATAARWGLLAGLHTRRDEGSSEVRAASSVAGGES